MTFLFTFLKVVALLIYYNFSLVFKVSACLTERELDFFLEHILQEGYLFIQLFFLKHLFSFSFGFPEAKLNIILSQNQNCCIPKPELLTIWTVLGCHICDKKMCSFDSGKPKKWGKIFWERKHLRGLVIGCLNYLFAK